jgi:hypothetical protein
MLLSFIRITDILLDISYTLSTSTLAHQLAQQDIIVYAFLKKVVIM